MGKFDKILVLSCAVCCLVYVDGFAQNKENDFFKNYDDFRRSTWQNYDNFKETAKTEYSKFMEQTWKWYESAGKADAPDLLPIPPVVKNDNDDVIPIDNPRPYDDVVPVPEPEPFHVPDPNPVPDPFDGPAPYKEPVMENGTSPDLEIDYYGMTVSVRFDESEKIHLRGTDEKSVAAFWEEMSGSCLRLLEDCLKIRRQLSLSDWAYYMLIEKISGSLYGKFSNEAKMMQSFVLVQSGYQLRIARASSGALSFMLAFDGGVLNKGFFEIDKVKYFLVEDCEEGGFYVFDCACRGERKFKLDFGLPVFCQGNFSEPRPLSSTNPCINVSVTSPLNLMEFYNDCPVPYDGLDVCSTWRYYANTPLCDEVKSRLYPALESAIAGKSEEYAANVIINFVQTAFEYGYDNDIWGGDRAFFADETIYYPYSDCEDRAILFSRIIRDLLGLDVVLVYYPNHLAAAVHFHENIPGDYLEIDGVRYLVCDPTYINASIGLTMPGMNNSSAKIVML